MTLLLNLTYRHPKFNSKINKYQKYIRFLQSQHLSSLVSNDVIFHRITILNFFNCMFIPITYCFLLCVYLSFPFNCEVFKIRDSLIDSWITCTWLKFNRHSLNKMMLMSVSFTIFEFNQPKDLNWKVFSFDHWQRNDFCYYKPCSFHTCAWILHNSLTYPLTATLLV